MIREEEKKHLHIGYKQTVRALNAGTAAKIFIAEDCEDRIKNSLKSAAAQSIVLTEQVSTMTELGKMCGIDVGASCAVIVKL